MPWHQQAGDGGFSFSSPAGQLLPRLGQRQKSERSIFVVKASSVFVVWVVSVAGIDELAVHARTGCAETDR